MEASATAAGPPTPPDETSTGNDPDPQDACLGIDIGSYRTRAALWVNNSEIIIENEHSYSLDGPCFPGDFPSSLYVFGEPPEEVYPLERHDPSRLSVSAKYVFYALANASDTLLEQYPLVHHLMKRKSDPRFQERLRSGLVALLSVVRDAASIECHNRGLRISKIGLTVPVQWTLEFEDVYKSLVSEVFGARHPSSLEPLVEAEDGGGAGGSAVGIDSSAIYFYTETEALARYLYKHHKRGLDPKGQYNTVMFFDFGGHNMNGCVFAIAHDSESPEASSFYRVGKTFGAGGGSGQWEHHIGEIFSSIWEEHYSTPPPPEHRENILFRFRTQKGIETASRQSISIFPPNPVDGSPSPGTLEPEHIEDAWRRAHERPLDTAEHEISRLVRMVERGRVSRPLVVVSGGTARNPAVKSRMKTLCRDSGVPVIFTDKLSRQRMAYDSAKVAKAAAYVVSETLTVEEFLRRGAAIGIQMRQALKQGEPKQGIREWDDSGALLLEEVKSHRDESHRDGISTRSGDEFRLICDPFFGQLAPAERERVAADRSYDVVYLGRRKQGSWLFRLNVEGKGDTMELVIEQFHRKRRRRPWKSKKTLRLPLYFDGNSGCIHVGARNKSIAELGLRLPPQPDDLGQTTVGHMEDSDQETDSDSDGDDQRLAESSFIHAQVGLGTDRNSNLGMFPTAARSRSPEAQGVLPSPQRRGGEKPLGSLRGNPRLDPYEEVQRMREAAKSRPRC